MVFGMAGGGFIFGVAGLITLIAVLAQLAKNCSFIKCSSNVMGSVVGKFSHYSKNNRSYTLDVEYTVNGVNYKRSIPATLSEYNTLEIGTQIELKYKPNKPKKIIRADMLTDKNMRTLRIVAIVAAAVTVISAVVFILAICLK